MKKTTTILIIILVLALIILTAIWLQKRSTVVAPSETISPVVTTPVTISSKPIVEEYFKGTRPVIAGSSVIVAAANEYVNERIAEFKTSADTQVPAMRKQYGNDAPPATYTIDFKAEHLQGPTTESIVVYSYVYMGGANGMSIYRVFTATYGGTTVMTLNDVVAPDKHDAFVAYVKKLLIDGTLGGPTKGAVFPEDVNQITFENLKNFSLDETSLTLYFTKYEIGPGALGAVVYPIPLELLRPYLAM